MKKEVLRMQDVWLGSIVTCGLEDFHLHIREGEMVNLVGLSGAGKTILYEYFMGHIPLHEGKVIYNGIVSFKGEYFKGITDVVCIGRGSTLIPGLSIAENIFIITGKRRVKRFVRMKNINYRAKILLGQYAPELSPETLVRDLSTAEQRMVEILRALESEAKLIVIDDVFQGYGQNDMGRILSLLEILKEKKTAILYESHELDFTRKLADKVVVLRKGRNVRTFYQADYDSGLCKKLLIGNDEPPAFIHQTACTGEKVFEIRNLTGEQELENLNLEFHKGEIVGFYDLNNRKNMELLNIIGGYTEPEKGGMYLEGQRYEPHSLDDAIRCGVGYIPRNMQDVSLVESMSFMENLCLPILKKTSYMHIFRSQKVLDYIENEYFENLGIPETEKERPVRYYDTYIQHSIFLMRWILFRPKVIVCMDPCGNADMIMRDIVYHALEELAKGGAAVLVASQNLNELKTISDTLYVMNSNEKSRFQQYKIREPENIPKSV